MRIEREIRNLNRTVGAMLSGEVAQRGNHTGPPDDIGINLHGWPACSARSSPAA